MKPDNDTNYSLEVSSLILAGINPTTVAYSLDIAEKINENGWKQAVVNFANFEERLSLGDLDTQPKITYIPPPENNQNSTLTILDEGDYIISGLELNAFIEKNNARKTNQNEEPESLKP